MEDTLNRQNMAVLCSMVFYQVVNKCLFQDTLFQRNRSGDLHSQMAYTHSGTSYHAFYAFYPCNNGFFYCLERSCIVLINFILVRSGVHILDSKYLNERTPFCYVRMWEVYRLISNMGDAKTHLCSDTLRQNDTVFAKWHPSFLSPQMHGHLPVIYTVVQSRGVGMHFRG